MKTKQFPLFFSFVAALLMGLPASHAQIAKTSWQPIGPDGGDARRFAFDPRDPSRIYLGTTDSWIYLSTDGGSTWSRIAQLAAQDNLVVDSLVVDRSDPDTIYAGVHVVTRPDGGVYISHDRGAHWLESPGIKGQAVLALTQAPSRPEMLIAGTLQGVFRTEDRGAHWKQISQPDIHEVQSIAIDPGDPNTVYAGTWHLPWKTTDGGAHWNGMTTGLIDDSDVFSMVVDRSYPSIMFLSACSGIYRSDTAGDLFHKIQGIPSTARRTRVLTMDPSDHNTVYAGTTEGLYKTTDGGKDWTRTTGPDVIINDVYVDPRNPKHVLLATDRSGVLASEDAGLGFIASNTGFSQRQVAALLPDANRPGTLYAGVVNDKTYGGVFVTADYGKTWKQQSEGLQGADVFLLAQSEAGTLMAGTSDGVFRWSGSEWVAADTGFLRPPPPVVVKSRKTTAHTKTTSAVHRTTTVKPVPRKLVLHAIHGRVTALTVSGKTWYAATAQGVFISTDNGEAWEMPGVHDADGMVENGNRYTAIAGDGSSVFVALRQGMLFSADAGETWQTVAMPNGLTVVSALALSPEGVLWAGGREGVFYTADHGATWTQLRQLPVADINSLSFDSSLNRLLLTSGQSTLVFAIDPGAKNWKWWNVGWPVHSLATPSGHLMAASFFSGVVVAPQQETASAGGAATAGQR